MPGAWLPLGRVGGVTGHHLWGWCDVRGTRSGPQRAVEATPHLGMTVTAAARRHPGGCGLLLGRGGCALPNAQHAAPLAAHTATRNVEWHMRRRGLRRRLPRGSRCDHSEYGAVARVDAGAETASGRLRAAERAACCALGTAQPDHPAPGPASCSRWPFQLDNGFRRLVAAFGSSSALTACRDPAPSVPPRLGRLPHGAAVDLPCSRPKLVAVEARLGCIPARAALLTRPHQPFGHPLRHGSKERVKIPWLRGAGPYCVSSRGTSCRGMSGWDHPETAWSP